MLVSLTQLANRTHEKAGDYSAVNFCAKPEIEMYREAEAHVGVAAEAPKYFVDDSSELTISVAATTHYR